MKKRLIAILTVLTMLAGLGTLQVSAATQAEYVYNDDIVNFICSLGIVNTDIDELESRVTRENFAVYVAKMLKGDDYVSQNRYFVDVESSAYSYNPVNFLVDKGVISVNADHAFRPGDYITYDEALKILVCALGGGDYGEGLGGFPMGYRQAAMKLDITISPAPADTITTVQAIELIYNTLTTVKFEKNYEGNVYFETSGDCLLNDQWKIYQGEGRITAVYGATLEGTPADAPDQIYIEGYEHKINIDGFDVLNVIGDNARYFYKKQKSDLLPEVVYISHNPAAKESITIEVKDYDSYKNSELHYYRKNGKIASVKLKNPRILYNGKPLETGVAAAMSSFNKGFVTIKDRDADGTHDLLVVWDYSNFYVGTVSGNAIYNRYGTGTDRKVDLDTVDALTIYDVGNAKITFADIAKGDVLSVAKSKDGKYVLAHKAVSTLTAKLDSINQGKDEYVLNGEIYKADKSYAADLKSAVTIGKTYNFVIDMFGYICSVAEATAGTETMTVGYVAALDEFNETPFDTTVKMKIFTQTGEFIIGRINDKVKIDGKVYRDSLTIKSVLTTYAFEKLIAYSAVEPDQKEAEQKSEYKELVIKSIDTINVDTAAGEQAEETLYAVWNGQLKIDDDGKMYSKLNLGWKAALASSTKIINVPSDANKKGDNKAYFVSTVSDTFKQDERYAADVYKLKGKNGPGDIVLNAYSTVSSTLNENKNKSVNVYVENYSQLNSEEEVEQVVKVITHNGEKTYVVGDSSVNFATLEPGDILDFTFDMEQKVTGYTVVYDADKTITAQPGYGVTKWGHINHDLIGDETTFLVYNYIGSEGGGWGGYRRDFQLSYGKVMKAYSDGTVMTSANATATNVLNEVTEVIITSGVKIIVVEPGARNTTNVRTGTVEDILSYEDAGDDCSTVIYYTYLGQGRAIVVYNL